MENKIKRVVSVTIIMVVVSMAVLPMSIQSVSAEDKTYSKTIFTGGFDFNTYSTTWRVSGKGWSLTASPTDPVVPLRSPVIAKFNSYYLDEGESGSLLMKETIDLSKAVSLTYDFYMYHDTEYEERDYVQPALTNGKTVRSYNPGKVYRYDGSTGWKRHTVEYPVEAAFAVDPLSPGLRGYGADGNNIFIDSLTITAKYIDKTAPGKPVLKVNNKNITNKSIKVTLEHGVDQESGVARSEYKIGEGGKWVEYAKPFTVSKNARIYARTIDKCGSTSAETSINIKNIDKTAPKINAKANKKTLKNKAKVKKSSVTVTIKDSNLKTKSVTKSAKKIKWLKNSKFTKKGKYVITATDKAGNKSKFTFTIK